LKKDKTFYFLSYETTRRQETGFSTIGDNFWLAPLANPSNYGLPAGSLVTSAQAAFLAAAPVNAGTVAYAQLAAGGTAVALGGAHGAPGALGVFPTRALHCRSHLPTCSARKETIRFRKARASSPHGWTTSSTAITP